MVGAPRAATSGRVLLFRFDQKASRGIRPEAVLGARKESGRTRSRPALRILSIIRCFRVRAHGHRCIARGSAAACE